MSKLKELYEEYKSLLDMEEAPKGSVRTLFKKFIVPSMFSLEARINKLERKPSDPQPLIELLQQRRQHHIPDGWLSAKAFSDKTEISSQGFIQIICKANDELSESRKKIGRHIYVQKENLINYLDSPKGREKYPKIAPQVDRYKERLKNEQQQRKGEADRKDPAFL